MEKSYIYWTLPFVFILFISCSIESVRTNVDKEGEHGFSFRESKHQWDKLKAKNGNSYTYTFLEQSFTGAGSETTIEVQKGKVVARHFEAFEILDDGSRVVLYTYQETSNKELGTHPEGTAVLTMDELYRTCISQYLIADPEANEIYFETNEQGVMMFCGYVPYGCHDDCYIGISLSHFSWK